MWLNGPEKYWKTNSYLAGIKNRLVSKNQPILILGGS